MSSEIEPGLRSSDAVPPVVAICEHPKWRQLNTKLGCIHPDHGPFPFPRADPFTGLRLVEGVPTRYGRAS